MFNFTFDRKTMYTILAVLMIIGILEYIMVPGKIIKFINKCTRSTNSNNVS